MSKCKGIPTYTQHSVAWPLNPRRDRVVDEVGVSFDHPDGGCIAEFYFRWIELRMFDHAPALRLECFYDGLAGLLDDRILEVLKKVRRRGDRETPPAKLIEILEANGVGPSKHQDGLKLL